MRSRLHRAALALVNRGIPVLPCIPGGKTPATTHGVLDATVDSSSVERWWNADPNRNVAIATGAASGILVVDVDGLDAEVELRKLEAEHGALPATVEVITGNGRHIWFWCPGGTTICNSVGKIAPGIDTRADNGYVLAPPSVHPSGRRYSWSVDSANKIAEPPAWLLAKIVDSAGGSEATPPSEWSRLATDGIAEGARNESIAKLTGYLLRRYVDPRVALELIRTWNAMRCRSPLADKEIEQIVNSIAGNELKRRQKAGHGR